MDQVTKEIGLMTSKMEKVNHLMLKKSFKLISYQAKSMDLQPSQTRKLIEHTKLIIMENLDKLKLRHNLSHSLMNTVIKFGVI